MIHDYTMECFGSTYRNYRGYATFMNVLYVRRRRPGLRGPPQKLPTRDWGSSRPQGDRPRPRISPQLLLLPLGAIYRLASLRREGGAIVDDGVISPLTRKYKPQFWWFELVMVYTRLACVFPWGGNDLMRRIGCEFVVLVNMSFLAIYSPLAKKSLGKITLAAMFLLFCVVVMSICAARRRKSPDWSRLSAPRRASSVHLVGRVEK